MKILISFTFLTLISFIVSGCGGGGGSATPPSTGDGSAVLTWTKPTQNTNDSELTDTDLDKFNVYFGSQADYEEDPDSFIPYSIAVDNQDGGTDNNNMNCQNLDNGEKMECTITGLDDETNWYFGVTAVNYLSIESERSGIVCKTFSGNCSTLLPVIEQLI